MIAAEQQQEKSSTNGVEQANPAVTYYSHNVGVSFKKENSVHENAFIKEVVAGLEAKDITDEDGLVTIGVDTNQFAHFMHMVYCRTPEGKKLRVEFDGIYPFDAKDAEGKPQKFNAQLVTISEVNEGE